MASQQLLNELLQLDLYPCCMDAQFVLPLRLSFLQVALLGAAGGIGQPLALLLKMNKYISELSLYDIAPFTPGVAKDISHCNTPSKVIDALYVGSSTGGCQIASR